MKRIALVTLAGLALVLGPALVLAPQAWAGETGTASITWDGASHIISKSATTKSLPQLIVEHLSNANTDDDSQNGLDDVAQIAADGPLASYSLVIDIDNPDTNIISPYGNIGEFTDILTNTITLNSDFAGITTFQQSSGLANGTSNLVLLVDGNALDKLIEELFGPDETLLETTASSFVGNTGHSGGVVGEDDDSIATAGGKKIVGGVASSTTSSTIVNVLDVGGDAGAFIEISNPVTGILSPHANVINATNTNNMIELNTLFAGVTTFQQQAGGANGQSNFIVLIYDTEAVLTSGQ